MKVLIKLMNLSDILNIYADDEQNEIFVNNSPVNYDARKFVGDISSITFNWKENCYNNKILDGEEFRVKIITDNNKERFIKGKNSFPANYGDFKEIINEVAHLWI